MKTVKNARLGLLAILVIAGAWGAGSGAVAEQHGIAAASSSLVASYARNGMSEAGIWMGEGPDGIWMGEQPLLLSV